MAYAQNPGRDKVTNPGIAALTNGGDKKKNKDNSDGSTTGTSAKTQGANTTARRNLNFKKVEKDTGGTESRVNQVTGKETVTNANQRATDKAAATNQLPGEITGNTTFDTTSGKYGVAPYKGKATSHGFKLQDGTFLRGSQNRFNNSPSYAANKKTYEKDLKNYTSKATAQANTYNRRASTHNNSK
jgi:hypothetical protein